MKKRITLTQEEINYILCEVNAVLQEDESGYMEDLLSVCKSLQKKLNK
tara:strand:+ start:472 stop:615 length:144 start_codon:yes stop_codon:yes gene_type:complete